ncbi:hypothetical protein [Methylobacterium tarhaniae]|uniref:hypothetical protein n=1 Tax=Methylobacterium tarhaniae TaxID=1187852 RepID=UPI003D051D76
MPLNMQSIFDIDILSDYKFHAARWNGEHQPLDLFTRDREDWVDWNRWRGQKDDFNRRHIISFIDVYQERWIWLFGGIFEVIARQQTAGRSYTIASCDRGSDLIGRLKIHLEIGQGKLFCLENLIEKINISEILKEPYSGAPFTGLDNVVLDFTALEIIIRTDRLD